MQQGFWKSFSRIALVTSLVIGGDFAFHAPLLPAQELDAVDQTGKVTKEPVFRVSKLVEDSQLQRPVGIERQPTNFARIAETPRNARIANSNSMAPGTGTVTPGVGNRNVLPSAIVPTKSILPRAASEFAAGLGAAAASPILTPAVALIPAPKAAPTPHPLDQAVEIARASLSEMRASVVDYTAILAKRESVNGVIGSPSYMSVKFRTPRQLANGTSVPFSIYMKFLKPKSSAGREVIWVDGQNKNSLIAHEPKGTLLGNRSISLAPTGFIAMKGQRHPIYKAGLESLIVNLIEKAERDRAAGPCICHYREGANINKRPCSCIELIHPDRRAPYEFHKAVVFIDDELNLPVRYAAYDWPQSPGGETPLIEEYTYYNVKVNVGLTDLDFDTKNPAYSYPRR